MQNKALIGGKASNLKILTEAGFNVPKWFVITAEEKLNETDILDKIEKHGINGNLFAVRSSAVNEDSETVSFAGQFESFLNVEKKDIYEKVKAVSESANSERVKSYMAKAGLEDTKVAVIVQEMIPSDISGVAFSINPVTGNRKSIVISSVFGLGEGLVSGLLNADVYTIEDGKIEKKIIDKETLTDLQIEQICAEVKKITALYKKPQDIEWTIAEDRLYILQSRPITALNTLTDKTDLETIWDNSNIIESYSGVTTPLTFSFIRDIYTEVYKQFLLIMGVERELIEKNNDIFEMLGLIEGRVYYNLLNWYRLLRLMPGYEINAGFMEAMMGVKHKLSNIPKVNESSQNKYLRLAKLIKSLAVNFFKLPKNIKKFYSHIDNTLSPYENSDLTKFRPHELIGVYQELEKKLIKNWQAPLVNDFYAMIFYGILKKTVAGIPDGESLQNDLLTGESGIISTEPVRKIREIANLICQGEKPDNKLSEFIKKFGNRCIGELKLETITYKQDPSLLLNILDSYVNQGYKDPEQDLLRELEIRKNAEKKAFSHLRGLKKLLFKFILKNARQSVKNRENLRFERTRLFGLIREIFLGFGTGFYAEGIIENIRDIFYLTKNEIFNYILGTSAETDLKAVISRRKSEFQSFENKRPADRFFTYGMVYHANSFSEQETLPICEGEIRGIGCCAGIVRAPVKIIKNVSDSNGLSGCILVAERTDPGWTPLFPISKGILVERGSILSHSAIVAREMGIPAIVGINNLLTLLKDGDEVEMDGSTGVVRVINND